jgi:hypothetical protein
MTDRMWFLGFEAGVKTVAAHLRIAADRIEQPQRDNIPYTRNDEKHSVNAIVKSGQPRFALKLRQLADEIEQIRP